MNNFYYKAKNSNGKITEGYIKAFSLADAANKIEKKGLCVLEISEESTNLERSIDNISITTSDTIFSVQEKKEFFNALYFQYKAGVPITESFKSIMASSFNPRIRGFCYQIIKKTEKGCSLKEALTKYTNVLGNAYTMLICAGEESGKLEAVLSNIIKNINKEEEIKRSIISSLAYPAIIFIMSFAVLILFNSFIFKMFDSIGTGETPCVTKLLTTAVIQILVYLGVVFCFTLYSLKNEKMKKLIINFMGQVKFISELLKDYYFQSFFTVMALAYEAGIPAAESAILANSVIKIKPINYRIQKSIQMIMKGCEITTAFGVAGVFSSFAMSQISAGEQSGELDKMFKAAAYDYEKKLELSIKVITKLIEPIMLVIVGFLVLYLGLSSYGKYYGNLFSII